LAAARKVLFGKLPATGKKMDAPCCHAFELDDGKIKRFDCYLEGAVSSRCNAVVRRYSRNSMPVGENLKAVFTRHGHEGNVSLFGRTYG
jgi:hypothetical protein